MAIPVETRNRRRTRTVAAIVVTAIGLAGYWLGVRAATAEHEPFVVEGTVRSSDGRGVCFEEHEECYGFRLYDDGFERPIPEEGDEIGIYVVFSPMLADINLQPGEERSGIEGFATAWWPVDQEPTDLGQLPGG